MDGGVVILEETTPIRIAMFHHKMKVTTQNNTIEINSDPQAKGLGPQLLTTRLHVGVTSFVVRAPDTHAPLVQS